MALKNYIVLIFLLVIAARSAGNSSEMDLGKDSQVQILLNQFRTATDSAEQRTIATQLSRIEPKTISDGIAVRDALKKQPFDLQLYEIASHLIGHLKNKMYENVVIEILKDEKSYWSKADVDTLSSVRDAEFLQRHKTVLFAANMLGMMKSQKAVPLLKEYLNFKGLEYYASNALAQIGNNSASAEVLEKVYRGEDVNYAGQGTEEAFTIVRDLEDESKKDKWPKIAKQIIHIREPKAKPHLKRLFNHERSYVRWESAGKFSQLVDENDVPSILEMTRNKDAVVRAEGINAMQRLKNVEFGDELIALLNDPDYNVRRHAAKALGYKKISRAVPYLEKAIKDSELRAEKPIGGNGRADELDVREEAYIALYILTGNKYDFKGKSAEIERRAEKQKRSPTFN